MSWNKNTVVAESLDHVLKMFPAIRSGVYTTVSGNGLNDGHSPYLLRYAVVENTICYEQIFRTFDCDADDVIRVVREELSQDSNIVNLTYQISETSDEANSEIVKSYIQLDLDRPSFTGFVVATDWKVSKCVHLSREKAEEEQKHLSRKYTDTFVVIELDEQQLLKYVDRCRFQYMHKVQFSVDNARVENPLSRPSYITTENGIDLTYLTDDSFSKWLDTLKPDQLKIC